MPRGIQLFTVFVAAIAFLSVGIFLHLTQGITAPSTQPRTTATQEVVFTIGQASVTAGYTNAEDDTLVIGITDQVIGEITLDLADSSRSYMSEMQIDATPHIHFHPTTINGLSGSITAGDRIQFQMTGDLTLAGITRSVTFAITAYLQAANQLTGHAEATISRTDFDLAELASSTADPGSDTITLELDFIASTVQ